MKSGPGKPKGHVRLGHRFEAMAGQRTAQSQAVGTPLAAGLVIDNAVAACLERQTRAVETRSVRRGVLVGAVPE